MFTRQEKILLFILASIQFSHIVDFMIVMPLGPQLIRIFGMTAQQFSLVVAAYTLLAGISGFIGSFFMDRFERKSILLFFFFGFVISTFFCALSQSYVALLVARGLAGTFGGVLNSITLSILSDQIPYEKRGTAIGITSTAFSTASIAGVPFSIFLSSHFNWHAPFIFLSVLSSLLFPMIWIFIPKTDSHLLKKSISFLKPIQEILRHDEALWGLAFMFMLFFSQFSIIPFLSTSLVLNGSLTEQNLPFVYLFGGIASILASPTIGRLSDRFGKAFVFKYGASFSILPIALLTHLGTTSVEIALLCSTLFFIGMSGRMVPAMALISGVPPPERRGSYMSLVSSVQSLSSALAAYLAGIIVVRDEITQKLIHYNWVGYIAIITTFFTLYLISKFQNNTFSAKNKT